MVTGRPREFVLEAALDQAVEVFWRQGYGGTTLDDLTRAMGINRPSLYNAFGNKEATFGLAVRRYAETRMTYLADAVLLPSARGAAEHYLRGALAAATGTPRGCLLVQGGLTGGKNDQHRIAELLTDHRSGVEARLAARFRVAVAQGDLSRAEQPVELAKYLFTTAVGVAVQAAAGTTRRQLNPVVRRALRAFP